MAKYLDSAGVKYLWQKIRKADDLTLTSIENIYQKKVSASGNVNRPLYVNSEGEFTVCNVFAGGTEVTLNGDNKGSAVVSFYAPTSAGANGQVLASTGGSPSWVSPSTLHVSYADRCDEATWASSADEAGSATTDSDGNKISTTYVKKSSIGQASGIAPLDATGKIASGYLPSYVDDVLEYTNRGSFPTTGETGKIYINISDGKTYRWSGSTYSEISASLALGTTSSTAYAGDKGQANADAINALQSDKLDKTSVSGTSGYIPKFSGTNSIGNSVISQAASNKTTIGGKLVVNAGADTSSGNCDEGIRVLPSSGWAELYLSNDSSITGANGWLVARRGSAGTTSGAVGDFTIEYNGWQGNGLTLYANGNRPRWKNNELAYKSDIPTNYVTTDGSAEQTISGNKRFTGNNNIFTGTVAINSILLTREQSAIFLHDEYCQKFLDIFGYDSDHSDNTHGWMCFGNTESGTSLLSKINPTWSSPNGNYDILTSAGGSITGDLYVSNEVETKNVYATNEVYSEGNVVSERDVRAGDAVYLGQDHVHLEYDINKKALKFVFA